MKTIDLQGNGQIRSGRTEIDVLYEDRKATFILPMNGPNDHKKVMDEINSQRLLRPTTAQVLALVDIAQQNPDEEHCKKILERFTDDYLWTGTESLSFQDGVLVYDNVNGRMPSNSGDLMGMVGRDDGIVRFVKKGFDTGKMPISDFLDNPYTIAQIGEEMIPIVRRVAERLNKQDAYVFGLDNSSQDIKRFTAVDDYYGGLGLDGSGDDDDGDGYASGVLDTGEASAQKIGE